MRVDRELGKGKQAASGKPSPRRARGDWEANRHGHSQLYLSVRARVRVRRSPPRDVTIITCRALSGITLNHSDRTADTHSQARAHSPLPRTLPHSHTEISYAG